MFISIALLLLSPFVDSSIPLHQSDSIWISMASADLEICKENPEFTAMFPSTLTTQKNDGISIFALHKGELDAFAGMVHRDITRHGGFIFHSSYSDAVKSFVKDTKPQRKRVEYTIDQPDLVQNLLGNLEHDTIEHVILELSSFQNRYYQSDTGELSAHWIYDYWTSLAQSRSEITVQIYEHDEFKQPSVILTIPGRQSTTASIVLGGHLDSIVSGKVTERAPGADDNASGIASLTELIRACVEMNYEPDVTVHFMAYAAEEVGLRGSGEIAEEFFQRQEQVLGVFQLDMTNYPHAAEDITFITDYTDANQNAFLMTLIDTYLDLSYTSAPCGYGCSDHASWQAKGYPASFPFEAKLGEHNPFIHTENDTFENCGSQTDRALDFTRLATTYIAELAKGKVENTVPLPGEETRWVAHITQDGGGFTTRFIFNNSGASASMQLFGYSNEGDLLEQVDLTIQEESYQTLSYQELFSVPEISHFSIFGDETVQVLTAIKAIHGQGASAHLNENNVFESPISFFSGEWESIFDGIALINTGDEPIQVNLTASPVGQDAQTIVIENQLAPKAKCLNVLESTFEVMPEDTRITIQCSGPFSLIALRGTNPDVIPGFLFQNHALIGSGPR